MSQSLYSMAILDKYLNLESNEDKVIVTYVWIDGTGENLRSKSRTLDGNLCDSINTIPKWSFDGSSTKQATTKDSEVILKPVAMYHDPFLGGKHLLVLCETNTDNGGPTQTNHRHEFVKIYNKAAFLKPELGIEQEYVLFDVNKKPFGWPKNGEPEPQGPYYCSVGHDKALGRAVAEAHYKACLFAGVKIEGINAEVMPSQWEFQVGCGNALDVCDDLWMSRYILHRIAETFGVVINFNPKPVKGNWNGSGAHFNFSTNETIAENGISKIQAYIKLLKKGHKEHIKICDPHHGEDNKKRLTGKHETSSISSFTSGVGDRTVSVRIPRSVMKKGRGYFEDRRPASNCDPYLVAKSLIKTCILTGDFDSKNTKHNSDQSDLDD